MANSAFYILIKAPLDITVPGSGDWLGGNVGIVDMDKRENESRKRRQLLIADSRRWIVGHFKNGAHFLSQPHAFWRKIQVDFFVSIIRNCRLGITNATSLLYIFCTPSWNACSELSIKGLCLIGVRPHFAVYQNCHFGVLTLVLPFFNKDF
jgi:hypothetical protein